MQPCNHDYRPAAERDACVRIDHDEPAPHIELRWMTVGRQAVDDLVAHLLDIVCEAEHGQAPATLRIVINSDYVTSSQPINYLFSRLTEHVGVLRPATPTRFAITFTSPPMRFLVNTFLQTIRIRNADFHIFDRAQYAEAVAWVLNDD